VSPLQHFEKNAMKWFILVHFRAENGSLLAINNGGRLETAHPPPGVAVGHLARGVGQTAGRRGSGGIYVMLEV